MLTIVNNGGNSGIPPIYNIQATQTTAMIVIYIIFEEIWFIKTTY